MQITLNEAEIVSAITDYVTSQINIADGHQVNVDLKAGRGENGFTAILDISPEAEPEAEAPKAKAKPAKVKKATKPTLVEDTPPEVVTEAVKAIQEVATDLGIKDAPDLGIQAQNPFAGDDADQTEAPSEEPEVVEEVAAEAPAAAEPAKEAPPSIFNFNK